MALKLSDAEVAEIRVQAQEGRSPGAIADDFGVSRRHVGRLVQGKSRPAVGGLQRDIVAEAGISAAVEHFLAGKSLSPGEAVIAETARALARQLDAAKPTAASAAAAPAVARQLVELIGRLAGEERPADDLDRIRARREARLLAAAAAPMV